MPELPEVEIHARNLRRWLEGRTVAAFRILDPLLSQRLDPAACESALIGSAVAGVRRRAKYLLVDLDSGGTLVIHLRMTGRFVQDVYRSDPPSVPTRFFLDLEDGTRVRFEDRRRFGRLWLTRAGHEHDVPELRSLGPDALSEPPDPRELREITARSRRSIKTLLMDQRVIGGLGNIYAAEVLHRAGVHPATPAREVTDVQGAAIARLLPELLEWAVETQSRGDLLYLGERGAENVFTVYRRAGEPCPACGTAIRRIVIGGRGTYLCPACQPLSG